MSASLTVVALTGIPEVVPGADLVQLLLAAVAAAGEQLVDGDVIAVSSKVVSKSLALVADPATRDGVIAGQTVQVVAERDVGGRRTQVVRSVAGPVMAAGGVDASNTGRDVLLTLPADPDAVAASLLAGLAARSGGRRIGVVLTDTAGRPWRSGQIDLALGAAGFVVLEDLRGTPDADGRVLSVTARALADEVAGAADLVKGKADRIPAAIVRGLGRYVTADAPGARSLVRDGDADWFALGSQEAVRTALGVPPGGVAAQSCGIRSTGPESDRIRVMRAVAVAGSQIAGAAAQVTGETLEITGADAIDLGMLAARLDVALHGEGIRHRLCRAGDRVWIDLAV